MVVVDDCIHEPIITQGAGDWQAMGGCRGQFTSETQDPNAESEFRLEDDQTTSPRSGRLTIAQRFIAGIGRLFNPSSP